MGQGGKMNEYFIMFNLYPWWLKPEKESEILFSLPLTEHYLAPTPSIKHSCFPIMGQSKYWDAGHLQLSFIVITPKKQTSSKTAFLTGGFDLGLFKSSSSVNQNPNLNLYVIFLEKNFVKSPFICDIRVSSVSLK